MGTLSLPVLPPARASRGDQSYTDILAADSIEHAAVLAHLVSSAPNAAASGDTVSVAGETAFCWDH